MAPILAVIPPQDEDLEHTTLIAFRSNSADIVADPDGGGNPGVDGVRGILPSCVKVRIMAPHHEDLEPTVGVPRHCDGALSARDVVADAMSRFTPGVDGVGRVLPPRVEVAVMAPAHQDLEPAVHVLANHEVIYVQ